MKFLRNPWVTGALAVVAVGVVFYQLFAPQLRSRRPIASSPDAPSVQSPPPSIAPTPPPHSTAPASASAGTSGTPAESPEPAMDRAYLETHFAGWVNVSQRDPFLLVTPEPAQKNSALTNSPVASWKLKGIWNQTGSHLAIINNGVYQEGDEIQGFRIEKIEGDEVWFRGTNGIERLGLARHRSAVRATPTNAPAVPR
jgi:hypothetical protein